MASQAKKIILGIDPGTNVLGYGHIVANSRSIQLVNLGVIQLDKITDPYLKLKYIFERMQQLVKRYSPDELAVESPFYGKNVQSMLKLGRAQGAAIVAGLACDIPVYEYAPRKIKQSITGNGNATKEQVAAMLQQILHFEKKPRFMDATDALSVAVCHHFQSDSIRLGKGGYNGWKAFARAHPERVNR